MNRSSLNRKLKIIFLISCLILTALALYACQKMDYSDIVTPSHSWITSVPAVTEPATPTAAYDVNTAGSGDTDPTVAPVKDPTAAPVKDPTAAPTSTPTPTEAPTPTPEPSPTPVPTRVPNVAFKGTLEIPDDVTDPIGRYEYLRKTIVDNADYYNSLDNTNPSTWCFQRKKDHSQSGTYEHFKMNDYNGYYVNPNVTDSDKVIYLTFDCGYPSDNTVAILDTLAAHNAKASFFVTKMYLEKDLDYAIRMKKEGHMVCNHTVTHTDLKEKSVSKIAAEIFDCAEYFYNQSGYEFDPFFRTPTGAYTKRLMTIISDAGYTTVFWSIAYGDYDSSNPLAPGYVLDHFTAYHHNGAIALMHNDSDSNVNELDAVLTMLENEGYRFGLLDELNQ